MIDYLLCGSKKLSVVQQTNIANDIFNRIAVLLTDFYEPLLPWLILALLLVIIDLRFGLMAARKRKEQIRSSRMWRRSLNKIFDYLCWVTFAGLCGRSIGVVMNVPIVSVGTLLVVYGIEISSCMNNYLEYKGIKKRFNFFKLIQRKDIEDTLEDMPECKEESKQ